MQRLVLSVLAAVAVLLVPSNRVSAGLWEKFWAKKHAYHNSARGVKHNHYHHHRADKCGTSKCTSCKCESHAFTAPNYQPGGYPPPTYQAAVYQPPVYQPPAYQPPVYQQPVSVPVATPAVTWQNVSRMEYRLQPQTQTVPVTRHRTVTVDEGAWHKVWVPKPVAKQVPETVYQQQTVYQPVPYHVTQQVPRVSYVSNQVAVTPTSFGPKCYSAYPKANWLGYNCLPPLPCLPPLFPRKPVFAPRAAPRMQYSLPPSALIVPPPIMRPPVTLGREIEPLESLESLLPTGPVPEPRADYGQLTPVRAADSHSAPTRSALGSGMFVPAPSAANIWRARQSSRLR